MDWFSINFIRFFFCSGIETKFKSQHYPVIIAPTHVRELNDVDVTTSGVVFGSAVSLTDVDVKLKELISKEPGSRIMPYFLHFPGLMTSSC